MTEQAAIYSTSMIQQGDDKEVVNVLISSTLTTKLKRWNMAIRNWIYPAHLEGLWLTSGIVTALYFGDRNLPYDVVNRVVEQFPNSSTESQVAACLIVGSSVWVSICIAMKFTLRMLLSYHGYMFEGRGKKMSLKTKIWGLLLKAIHFWNPPHLYSFQHSLPNLPVPALKDTIQRHLRTIRPTLDEETFRKVEKEARDFQNGVGKRLQRYLILKSWWARNYVSDWWEQYVYLRSRGPLLGYSNIYSGDNIALPTNDQATRAASYVYQLLQFREKIDSQTLTPIVIQNIVPLCSWQNSRVFNTTRIPGIETDKLVHLEDSNHIVVLSKGCYYKVIIRHKGRLLNAREIQFQLECILAEESKSSENEKNLASLTAWNRTKWAEVRDKHFKNGVNKNSLDVIESAAFVLILDDVPYDFDLLDLEKRDLLNKYGKQCLTGRVNGYWFDKSFNFAVGTNGRFTFNAEHTHSDGTVLARMMEEAMFDDTLSYDETGKLLSKMEKMPPKPIKLNWNFNDELNKKIEEAHSDGMKVFNNIDHRIMMFDPFGKGFIKTCNLSPDAYIQMAIQLAYFRDFGKFSLTYEASMTRLYLEGRTETVRSCTIESSAWVRAMEDEKFSTIERVKLLQEACKQHQKGYLEAMTGKGIDRHLFCLYVVSKGLEVESPFLQGVFSEAWKLSTSQTPHGQTAKIDLKKYPELKSFAGGFGPIADDSYSVSYIISGEDMIYFHLSSMKSCQATNTERFEANIRKAMCDVRDLMNEYKKIKSK